MNSKKFHIYKADANTPMRKMFDVTFDTIRVYNLYIIGNATSADIKVS